MSEVWHLTVVALEERDAIRKYFWWEQIPKSIAYLNDK